MKPFLLLSTRPEDVEADRERVDVARFGGISESDVVQIRLERDRLGEISLDDYSGVIVGGGPYNMSEPVKDELQLQVESEMMDVTQRCIDADFPYLGMCYGMGVLAANTGGIVDREFGEEAAVTWNTLTDEGRSDPLFEGFTEPFSAVTGHKEACSRVPADAVLLATSEGCPVQVIRVGANVYATQFHPELDNDSLAGRLSTYRDGGYFVASEVEQVLHWARTVELGPEPNEVLRRFCALHARD